MVEFNKSNAQFCPPIGFINGTSLYFFCSPSGPTCGERPTTVMVGTSEFNLMACESAYAIYDLTSGSPIANINYFLSDFGLGTFEYTCGDLIQETLSIVEVDQVVKFTKVFRNRLFSDNSIHLMFVSYLSGTVSMYDITGKKVLSLNIDYASQKEINASALTNGVYLLKIEAGSSTISKKVIIMR